MSKKIAYFQCSTGISGDMILSALINAGADINEINNLLKKLNLPDWELQSRQITKQGISAMSIQVLTAAQHHHRHLAEIEKMIYEAKFAVGIEERAIKTFNLLADAEGFVHHCSKEEIHFHEVGAVDSIIDIVGSCIAVELLGLAEIYCSPIPLGTGVIQCAHGLIPAPAPACLKLAEAMEVVGSTIQSETATPTGMALIKCFLEDRKQSCVIPRMKLEQIAVGAGQKDFAQPNILRVLIGTTDSEKVNTGAAQCYQDTVVVLETVMDDISGEIAGYLWEVLLQAGALDMYYTPVMMKKGRPGIALTVLTPFEQESQIVQLMFRETTAIGLRRTVTDRILCLRTGKQVQTKWGPVAVKVSSYGQMQQVTPEYEACKKIAQEQQLPLKTVYAEIIKNSEVGHESDFI